MQIGTARAAAADWVRREGSRRPGYHGAFFSGSTVGLPDDAELDAGSDVDVVVLSTGTPPPLKVGKFEHRGVLLEVSDFPWSRFASASEVLASYHLAGSFRTDTVIDDPTGDLRALQVEVARSFADEGWVRRRCMEAQRRVEEGMRSIDFTEPWHDQVTAWLFPGGVTTHVLLVAALRNPTVRLRYLRAREVLERYGHPGIHDQLLRLLGSEELTAARAGHHLDNLERAFDTAASVARTPFFFSSDITPPARRIAIDAGRELALRGFQRETVFWTVATFARCQAVLAADAPRSVQRVHRSAFDELLADLGITSSADLRERAEAVLDFAPTVWATAESVIAANPGIRHRETV
ncbi:hypothetical protein [Kitasatospora sp. NPDC058218]|uniref:hypothetical protein n=1 Tax=Kitasatospora sp. NPDC058218 TaxID=3346385 RepID=UPI0036DE710A